MQFVIHVLLLQVFLLILFANVLVMIFRSQFVRVIGLRLLRCSVLFPFFLEALLMIRLVLY